MRAGLRERDREWKRCDHDQARSTSRRRARGAREACPVNEWEGEGLPPPRVDKIVFGTLSASFPEIICRYYITLVAEPDVAHGFDLSSGTGTRSGNDRPTRLLRADQQGARRENLIAPFTPAPRRWRAICRENGTSDQRSALPGVFEKSEWGQSRPSVSQPASASSSTGAFERRRRSTNFWSRHDHPYRVSRVTGDRYAGEFPRELFRKHGIAYDLAKQTKSELFRDLLPLLNSSRIVLPRNDRLLGQIVGLERRTSAVGRDTISHPDRGHDDVANAVAGAAALSKLIRHQLALGVGRRRERRSLAARPSSSLHQQRGAHPTMMEFLRALSRSER